MLALDPRSRAIVAASALALFAAAHVTAAHVDSAALAGMIPAVPQPARTPDLPALRVVVPKRDPFAGPPRMHRGPVGAPLPAALPPLPSIPALSVSPASAQQRVTALVTGDHPAALVEEGAAMRLVGVGDTLIGDRIVAIDAAGVHLARGTTLSVAPIAAPSPAPSPLERGLPPIPAIPSLGGRP